MSLQRLAIFVPNLTELILDNSCILSLRDIGCDFKFLQKLSVVNCGLDSLDGCFAFTDLKEFRAGKNEIKDVGQSMFMDSVRILDFQGNPVKDIMCLKFLVMCEELEELNLVDCPATLEPDYRDIVASILPKLKVLDGIPIEDSERGWPHESDDEDEEDDQDRGDGAGKSSELTDEANTRGDVPNNSGDSSSKSTNSQNVNSSTFGDFNTGCRKIILPPIKERPTSAVSKTTLFKKELRKNRPATANSRMINTDFNIQKARVKIFLPSDKTHSSELYENSRKEKSENSQNKLEKISVELKQKSLQMNAVKCCNNTKYKTFSNSVDSLVNASRKWRQVYNVYRSQRRERWFQELQDDLSLDYMERKEEDSYDTDISNKINTAALQICSVDTIHTCTIPTSLC